MTSPDVDRDAIKAEFRRERGYWRPWNDTMLRERPGFLLRYARYAGYPARTGPLSPRMVELIYIGLDASSSHLFESGLRTHMHKALEAGATAADIFDVLHLVAAQGIECVTQATAILTEETASHQPGGETKDPMNGRNLFEPGYAEVVQAFLDDGAAGDGLTPSERCLIQVALNACFSAYNPTALRQYIHSGLELGLTSAQMLQAIQLGAHLSVHGTALGAQVFEALR